MFVMTVQPRTWSAGYLMASVPWERNLLASFTPSGLFCPCRKSSGLTKFQFGVCIIVASFITDECRQGPNDIYEWNGYSCCWPVDREHRSRE